MFLCVTAEWANTNEIIKVTCIDSNYSLCILHLSAELSYMSLLSLVIIFKQIPVSTKLSTFIKAILRRKRCLKTVVYFVEFDQEIIRLSRLASAP